MEKFKVDDLVMILNVEEYYKSIVGHKIGHIGKIIKIHYVFERVFYEVKFSKQEELKFTEEELILIERK